MIQPADTAATTRDQARDAIGNVDRALDTVNGYRASLGAMQNRLNSTSNSLSVGMASAEVSSSVPTCSPLEARATEKE